MSDGFDVFLSYNSRDKPLVVEIGKRLRDEGLCVWLDNWELRSGLRWQKEIEKAIQASRAVAVFVGAHGLGDWQEPEVRAFIARSTHERVAVIPVLLPGCPEFPPLPLFLNEFTRVDLRNGLSGEAWERLVSGINGVRPEGRLHSGLPTERLSRPGILRDVLDRRFPRFHSTLTRLGTLPEPPELRTIRTYLQEDLKGLLGKELHEKTRLPLHARTVPEGPYGRSKDPFVRPVHRIIRQVLGQAQGGDSASAEIAAVHRKSESVKNVLSRLLKSPTPLVLLGDPGSGKTITLQEAAFDLASSELRRVYPIVTLYVRLGEFHVDGDVRPAEVLDYVKGASPPRIRPWIEELDASNRLVILFDGMDEMSRERYNEHTEALSSFATSREKKIRTLFSCRITDFSPAFVHCRLALLPFDRSQIGTYLEQFLQVRSLQIDGATWKISHLARKLASGELPIDATNPFVLWLLCDYLREEETWPESRVQLLRVFLEKTYDRKQRDAQVKGLDLPPVNAALHEWSRIAFIITERNRGTAIPVKELIEQATDGDEAERLRLMIRTGKECGVLTESIPEEEHLIRFENHRLQEYFTAVWICENEPRIAWLDKLDAPRWQETMINLVLMGGAEDGVEALSLAIKTEIRAFQEPKQQIPYEREVLLAHRIELGAQVSLHSAEISTAVSDQLRPCLREAVDTLVERGSPLTQVKMMRACRHLKDSELLTVLEKPLDSKTRWVRDQALILVAGRSGLATRMGFHLATNDFLPSWPAYLKALQAAGGKRAWNWTCFLFATVCALGNLALLFLCSWGLFEALRVFYSPLLLSGNRAIQSFLTLGVTAFAFRVDRSHLWAWILWCAPIGHLLVNLAFALWKGDWLTFPGTLMLSVGVCLPFVVLVPILGLLLHQGTLLLYSVAARRERKTMRRYLSLAWTECGFEGLPDGFKLVGGVIAFGLLGSTIVLSLWYLFGEVLPKTSERLGLSPWVVPLLFVFGLLTLPFAGPSAYRLVREQIERPSLIRPLNSALSHIATAGTQVRTSLGTRAGLRKTSSWVFLRLAGCLGLMIIGAILVGTLSFVGTLLAKLLVILGVVAAATLLGYEVFHWMRSPLAALRPYPPGFWQISDWRSALTRKEPPVQDEILRRSTHQSLGLQHKEFLRLLEEIAPLIQEEPAFSTYLRLRDGLEQAVYKEEGASWRMPLKSVNRGREG